MRLSVVILLVILFSSCNKEKLKSADAFFIRSNVNQIGVAITNTLQGSASQKITDLSLYVNGLFKGVYPIGSTLPIPSTGPTNIQIYPVIKNNGISGTRQPYEFYDRIVIDTAVNPGVIVDRGLLFKYKTNTKFAFLENFSSPSGSGIAFKYSPGSDLSAYDVFNDSRSLEGAYMHFMLHDDYKNAQFETTSTFPLPGNGAPVYIELNYKCDVPFYIGVCNGSDYRAQLTVNKSSYWNKIYVQISTVVTTEPTYATYGIFIKAVDDGTTTNPEFFIDNVKVLSY